MDNKEYQKQWRQNHPEKIAEYKAKRKKQRKCWHCKTDIPWNRRICDTCACTTIICRTCGESAKILRSKRRYKASYFCSKECQHKFFQKGNIWKMYDELQSFKSGSRNYKIDEQIVESQQQQIEELLAKNQELQQRIKELNVLQKKSNDNQLLSMREIMSLQAKKKKEGNNV